MFEHCCTVLYSTILCMLINTILCILFNIALCKLVLYPYYEGYLCVFCFIVKCILSNIVEYYLMHDSTLVTIHNLFIFTLFYSFECSVLEMLFVLKYSIVSVSHYLFVQFSLFYLYLNVNFFLCIWMFNFQCLIHIGSIVHFVIKTYLSYKMFQP